MGVLHLCHIGMKGGAVVSTDQGYSGMQCLLATLVRQLELV